MLNKFMNFYAIFFICITFFQLTNLFSALIINDDIVKQDLVKAEEYLEKTSRNKIINNKAEINIKKDYIAVLEIPAISLEKGFMDINSKQNTVDKNIQIIKGSTMPDNVGGNLILAAHSGQSGIAYFKNLHKVQLKDKVNIYYNGIKYIYQIYDKYKLNKNGEISIKRNNETMLTLTTCDIKDDKKQLVVLAKLLGEEKY